MTSLFEKIQAYLQVIHSPLVEYLSEGTTHDIPRFVNSLRIIVDIDEVTVVFKSFHEHFPIEPHSEPEDIHELIDFCIQIIEEKLVLFLFYDQNNSVSKMVLDKPSTLVKSNRERVEVLSFKGTFDRTFKPGI